jgi:hypothetical protein
MSFGLAFPSEVHFSAVHAEGSNEVSLLLAVLGLRLPGRLGRPDAVHLAASAFRRSG